MSQTYPYSYEAYPMSIFYYRAVDRPGTITIVATGSITATGSSACGYYASSSGWWTSQPGNPSRSASAISKKRKL
jgi:hypothetical protein